jgi:hypothetical protein
MATLSSKLAQSLKEFSREICQQVTNFFVVEELQGFWICDCRMPIDKKFTGFPIAN